MCHLTAAEKDADLHTILVLEKLFGLTQLGPNVFVTGFGTKSNLFCLRVGLAGIAFFYSCRICTCRNP